MQPNLPSRNDPVRRSFAIFLVFLAVGFAAGITYAWLLAPSRLSNGTPEQLNPVDREIYIRLIADSYAATGDRAAAAARMDTLGAAGPDALVSLIMSDLQGDRSTPDNAQLANLALALEIESPTAGLLAEALPLPPATSPPQPPTDPVAIDEPVFAGKYILIDRQIICTPGSPVRRIEVLLAAEDGQSVPGATLRVIWDGGEEQIVTGFNSEQSAGYVDFEMEPDKSYSLSVAGDDPSVNDLTVQFCPDGQEGGWRLAYRALPP